MTRNEFIAKAAARLVGTHTKQEATAEAIEFADYLEAANVAPWQTPAPAPSDTAAKVVEAAELWEKEEGTIHALSMAVRAHLAAKQGGAK